jgi:hypothetical protein
MRKVLATTDVVDWLMPGQLFSCIRKECLFRGSLIDKRYQYHHATMGDIALLLSAVASKEMVYDALSENKNGFEIELYIYCDFIIGDKLGSIHLTDRYRIWDMSETSENIGKYDHIMLKKTFGGFFERVSDV